MPSARRSRIIAAPAQELWEVIADPHHLPRWWPRVARIEDVAGNAFTEVMKTAKGKSVRADFELVEADAAARSLPDGAVGFLTQVLGRTGHPRPPVALNSVRVPATALPARALQELERIVGARNVRFDHSERVAHAAGRGYPDLVRLRAGELEGAPDAVVAPAGHEQVRPLLEH